MKLVDELRVKQGTMTQSQFASVLNVSEGTLSQIYSGKRQIGEALARRIADVYPDLLWIAAGFVMTKGKEKSCHHDDRTNTMGQ